MYWPMAMHKCHTECQKQYLQNDTRSDLSAYSHVQKDTAMSTASPCRTLAPLTSLPIIHRDDTKAATAKKMSTSRKCLSTLVW
eukprot:scaffold1307_cov200-Pinguiococcus_pyrenoidosus.AAC.55